MKLKATYNEGSPGDVFPRLLAIHADEEALEGMIEALLRAKDDAKGLGFIDLDGTSVHVFRTPSPDSKAVPGVGTVIRGTQAPQDLWPALIAELEKRDPEKAARIRRLYAPSIAILESREMRRLADADDRRNVDFLVWEQMFDALNRLAPEGTYFGASAADVSDYGFHPAGDGS